jgi:HlyD family secretion protein
MEVEAEVDETDVVAVRPGQKSTISVDAFPDTTFAGTVSSVGNSGRRQGAGGVNEVINFEVDVRFNTADPRLKPGMTADVEVETKTRTDVLTVPIQALVARSRGTIEKDRKAAHKDMEQAEASADSAAADTLRGEAREAREKEVVEGVYAVVDDRAVFVPVTTGIADESRIEVTGELAEGDVVVSGPYRVLRDLKEGTKIKGETSDSEAS